MVLLYVVLKGYKFSVGKIIENSILSYYRGNYRGLVPPSNTNHKTVHLGRCGRRLIRRKKACPKVSSLTLTGITKGPKNRGNKKDVEVEKYEGDTREIEQV